MQGNRRKCDAPVKVGTVLESVLKGLGLEKAVKAHSILTSWKEIVGDGIALHAEPKEIKNGVLFLKVENAAWRSQLFALKGDLLKKVNNHAGKKIVNNIYFL